MSALSSPDDVANALSAERTNPLAPNDPSAYPGFFEKLLGDFGYYLDHADPVAFISHHALPLVWLIAGQAVFILLAVGAVKLYSSTSDPRASRWRKALGFAAVLLFPEALLVAVVLADR
ncbi:hypothetical protein [Phaeospirillum tilakii]|uniref:Uncharacterized protein n=1 Tax=Phaeospirillum tilakii TaxID=741673 RepID=A0ABW5CH86_9PROT